MHPISVVALHLVFLFSSRALTQNCGPQYGNSTCQLGDCCSQYGWCDTDFAHCDPSTCRPEYSGAGSSCAGLLSSSSSSLPSSSRTSSPLPPPSYSSSVPNIDSCGSDSGSSGTVCPGAGVGGFFYRCCSGEGHCGPKNSLQAQALYCGDGCQAGYGLCGGTTRRIPPDPTASPGIAPAGDTCGPIVNRRCAPGLCCSGSNYCGTGPDFCGTANWCQPKYGACSGS